MSPPLKICDLSPFYCETGGGIRTYHRARISWFANQEKHQYVLVAPGPRFSVLQLAPTVTMVSVYGPRMTRDPDGYRLLFDYPAVRSVIGRLNPNVLEAGDPWFSGPFSLLLRRWGVFNGLLSSFYHSDGVATYLGPRLASQIVDWMHRQFFRMQSKFDVTVVASDVVRQQLRARGVLNVVKAPFGVDPALFDIPRRRAPLRRRVLYLGRLDADKEFNLVLDVLPDVLKRPDVFVTVVGKGRYQGRVANVRHPRFQYLGFISDPRSVRSVYAAHDVLVAPGRFETFGLASLEAAAAGLVVIGPDAGGTGEMLRDIHSCLMFPAGDRAAFLERILEAIDGDTAALAERSRASAASYGTWQDAVARHVAVYEALSVSA